MLKEWEPLPSEIREGTLERSQEVPFEALPPFGKEAFSQFPQGHFRIGSMTGNAGYNWSFVAKLGQGRGTVSHFVIDTEFFE